MKIAVCLLGHYRSFDRVSACWDRLKVKYNIDFYISTWDCVDSNTKSWHTNGGNALIPLSELQIKNLKRFDCDVIIDSQSWTDEERTDIYLGVPIKLFEYRFQMYNNVVKRIQESGRKYDLVVFSRLDIALADLDFVPVPEGTIHIGYRTDTKYSYSLAASDIFFAIHFDNIGLMTDPHIGIRKARENNLYEMPENYANDFYYTKWVAVVPTWKYNVDFAIVR